MFTEVPEKKPYDRDPLLEPQVRDYHHMLKLINHLVLPSGIPLPMS